MVYANDQWIQLPTRDLYDTQIMAMAINAARDMYEKGQQEMKDFQKTYGDFLTPIMADQDWYNQNVTGKVRDAVNALYAQGIDPLRNAQGRAVISQLINNMPYGDIAKLRESAKNAEQYLKARTELEMKGLYNPLTEAYAGPGLDKYSTRDNGIWNRMSPVPYQNMSDFSKAYFEGIKPIERHATKDGIQYTISEITPERLHQIADDHFNDLVNTPQGQLMYKMYKDKFGSDEAAREAFNNAVVSGNLRKITSNSNFNEQQYKQQQLNLQRENLNLKKQQIAIQRMKAENARKKQELEEKDRWTTRQRNDIAARANLNKQDIDNLNRLKKEATFNGARAAIIARHAENGVKYNPTVKEVHEYMNQARQELKKANYYKANYAAQSVIPTGDDQTTARAIFDNFSSEQPTGDITGQKSGKITFGKGQNLSLTKQKELEYGNRNLTSGSASSKLYDYLNKHNISGFRHGNQVSVNHRTLADGVSQWDVNGTIRIRKSDLSGFGTDEQLNAAVEQAGGSIIKMGSASVVKNRQGVTQKGYSAQDWVVLPVTRTLDPTIHGDSEIDVWHEKQYGKKYAHDEQSQFFDEDIIDYEE